MNVTLHVWVGLISAKIYRFRTRLIVWILLQLISKSETKKEYLEFDVEQSWKEIVWKTFFALENLQSFFRK